jgi:hypothetical protein
MRVFRALALVALVAFSATDAMAQATRGFKDSWFWGVKGGAMYYQVQSDSGALAPLTGLEWFITRSKGGLYVSFDHSFFSNQAVFVNDSVNPLYTGPRPVLLSGMRRFTAIGMFFPLQSYRVHPYVGLGAALSYIASANPQGAYVTPGGQVQKDLVEATIQEFRSTASPMALLGAQARLPLISVFGQLTATPANSNFFLFTGTGVRATAEFGVRYNFGTSIDQMR